MGERMVEGLESLLPGNIEHQGFFGGRIPDLDARAVVVGAPVERDFDAGAGAAGQLLAGLEDLDRRLGSKLFHGWALLSLEVSDKDSAMAAIFPGTTVRSEDSGAFTDR